MIEIFSSFDVWSWLSLGVILMLLELIVPGVFLFWVGLGSALTALVALLTDWTISDQLICFSFLSIISLFFGLFVYKKIFASDSQKQTADINDINLDFVGKTYTVSDAITEGQGKVKVGDTVWIAECQTDVAKGQKVVVEKVNGTVLLVRPKK